MKKLALILSFLFIQIIPVLVLLLFLPIKKDNTVPVIVVEVILIAIVLGIDYFMPFKFWFRLMNSHIYLSPYQVFGLNAKIIDTKEIVEVMRDAQQASLTYNWRALIHFHEESDEVRKLMSAMIKLKNANVDVLTQERLSSYALAGGDPAMLADAVIKAERSHIEYNLEALLSHNLESKDLNNVIDCMFSSLNAGYPISQSDLLNFSDKSIIKYITGIYLKARKYDLNISFQDLVKMNNAGGDLDAFIVILMKAKSVSPNLNVSDILKHNFRGFEIAKIISAWLLTIETGLLINLQDLIEYELIGGKANKMVDCLIKANQNNIKITLDRLKKFFVTSRIKRNAPDDSSQFVEKNVDEIKQRTAEKNREREENMERLINAQIQSNKSNLGLTLEELEEYALVGIDALNLVNAYDIMKNMLGINNALDVLLTHFFKGGNPISLAGGLSTAKAFKVDIILPLAAAIDLASKGKLSDVIKNSLNPKVISTPPFDVVIQDGTEMQIVANVIVVSNLKNYFYGSKDDVLISRVIETVSAKVTTYSTYEIVIKSTAEISRRILRKLLGLEDFSDYYYVQENEDAEKMLLEVLADSKMQGFEHVNKKKVNYLKLIPVQPKDKFAREMEIQLSNQREKDFNDKSRYEIIEVQVADIAIIDNIVLGQNLNDLRLQSKIDAETLFVKERMAAVEMQNAMAEAIRKGGMSIKDKMMYDIMQRPLVVEFGTKNNAQIHKITQHQKEQDADDSTYEEVHK